MKNLVTYLETHTLSRGIGTHESACSIAAINLALTGRLTDKIPECMSEVLGKAIIVLQDAMPDEMRNSKRYKALLPLAAGTGREKEQERLAVLLEWMWGTVLPDLQGLADEKGFGAEWATMCKERTSYAAYAAYAAAYAAYAAARAATYAAYAAYAATYAADASYAAYAAAYAADATDAADFWQRVDVIGVIEKMVNV